MSKMHVACHSISVKSSSQKKCFEDVRSRKVHSFLFYWKHFQITVLSHCHEHKAVTSFGFLYHFMQIFWKCLWDKCFQRLGLSQKLQLSFHAGWKHLSSTDFYHIYYLLSSLLQSIWWVLEHFQCWAETYPARGRCASLTHPIKTAEFFFWNMKCLSASNFPRACWIRKWN